MPWSWLTLLYFTLLTMLRLQSVGLTGLTAPALLGWGLRVIVCAWSVSVTVWVGPLKDRLQSKSLEALNSQTWKLLRNWSVLPTSTSVHRPQQASSVVGLSLEMWFTQQSPSPKPNDEESRPTTSAWDRERQGDELDADEKAALETLRGISSGQTCLSEGGEHAWHAYQGCRSSGRICSHCFMSVDVAGNVLWRISPPTKKDADPAEVLAAWRAELARVSDPPGDSGGDGGAVGCLYGPSHRWVRTSAQAVGVDAHTWLEHAGCASGRYCAQCGAVQADGSLAYDILPNAIAQFGRPSERWALERRGISAPPIATAAFAQPCGRRSLSPIHAPGSPPPSPPASRRSPVTLLSRSPSISPPASPSARQGSPSARQGSPSARQGAAAPTILSESERWRFPSSRPLKSLASEPPESTADGFQRLQSAGFTCVHNAPYAHNAPTPPPLVHVADPAHLAATRPPLSAILSATRARVRHRPPSSFLLSACGVRGIALPLCLVPAAH